MCWELMTNCDFLIKTGDFVSFLEIGLMWWGCLKLNVLGRMTPPDPPASTFCVLGL